MSRIYDLGGRPAGSAAAPTATIGGSASVDASLTAQLGPTALSLSAASVTTGATLAWTVYGPLDTDETAQIITAGSTSATPTWAAFTAAAGKIPGLWVVKCVVTKDASSTTYTRRVRVGDTDGRYQTHGVIWANEPAGALNTTITADGIVYTEQAGTVAVTASGLTIDASSAVQHPSDDIGPRSLTYEDDVVFYVAVDASISGATHNRSINILNAAGTYRGGVRLSHTGASHQIELFQSRNTTLTYVAKALASQALIVAVRWFRGILFEPRYSLVSLASLNYVWPAFSTMSEILSTNDSNSFTPQDASGAADTAPAPAISGSLLRHSAAGNTSTEIARAVFVRSAL